MKTPRWLVAAALSISVGASAHAQLLLYDLRGTVDSLFGAADLFGSTNPGASFELSYLAEHSVGYRSGGGGAAGSSNYLTGGTAFELRSRRLSSTTSFSRPTNVLRGSGKLCVGADLPETPSTPKPVASIANR